MSLFNEFCSRIYVISVDVLIEKIKMRKKSVTILSQTHFEQKKKKKNSQTPKHIDTNTIKTQNHHNV